jgi:hypothetical protein
LLINKDGGFDLLRRDELSNKNNILLKKEGVVLGK